MFCGRCGAIFEDAVTPLRILLRPRAFAASPGDSVLVPRMTSTLFPRLPRPARNPFRVALVLMVVAAAALSALDINAALGAGSVLAGPVIFVLYMWQADEFRDIPRRALVISWLVGAGLAVVWWWFTGLLVAGSYGVTTADGLALQNVLPGFGLAVTIGGSVLMVLPPLVVRLLRIPVREPLDGYVIGAFGALSYTSAASITWMMPQIVTGLLESQSAWRMFGDAITYGVIDPLTSVALVGLVGMAVWFRPRAHTRARRGLLLCVAVAAVIYVAVWIIDALSLPYLAEIAINLALTASGLVNMRCGIQLALLHEQPDAGTGAPILCVNCENVVPDLPFCVACGAASGASSYSSRCQRRQSPPLAKTA